MHKHYCENDSEALIALFDEPFAWFGAGEDEYALGRDTVAGIFREFAGKVPRCNLTDEEYEAIELAPGVYLCTGRAWIATDPSTNVYLRVHQRITTVFRKADGAWRCNHIHISNPYSEMVQGDVGFPTGMARQTAEYLQEQIEVQRREIAEQAAEIESMYNTVPCAIIRYRRTEAGYEQLMSNPAVVRLLGTTEEGLAAIDWSRGYCSRVVAEDVPAMEEAVRGLREVGDRASVVCRIQRDEGDVRYMESDHIVVGLDERGLIVQEVVFDITDRIELERALVRLGYEDVLTGLYNRNRFNEDLNSERLVYAERLGVACLDLNGLKNVNDRLGHSAGDDLIRRTGRIIGEHFAGRAYRIGGDEFVIIETGMGEDVFSQAVDEMCAALVQEGISIAAGLSWHAPATNPEEQVIEADHGMYRAKAEFYSQAGNDRRHR